MLRDIPLLESFILDYIGLFTIGQQQEYTADCIVLVEYCEKQFCVRLVVSFCWYMDGVTALKFKARLSSTPVVLLGQY